MRLPRFSVFQLMMLATATGALLAYFLQDRTSKLNWSESVLTYETADVPEEFEVEFATEKRTFEKYMNGSYSNGSDLYHDGHRAGWEACRYHFFRNFKNQGGYKIIGKPSQFDLNNRDHVPSVIHLAYAIGYNRCESQINELQTGMSQQRLRTSLATRKIDSRILLILSAVCMVMAAASIYSSRRSFRETGMIEVASRGRIK